MTARRPAAKRRQHLQALVPILTHEFTEFKCGRADRYRARKPPTCHCLVCAVKWQGKLIHLVRYQVGALEHLHKA